MTLVKLVISALMAAFAIVVVAFAISNRDPLTLTLWPLPGELSVPTYMLALAALALGFLWGGIAAWLSGGRARAKARVGHYQTDFLERENRYLRRKAEQAAEEREALEEKAATAQTPSDTPSPKAAPPKALPPANAA